MMLPKSAQAGCDGALALLQFGGSGKRMATCADVAGSPSTVSVDERRKGVHRESNVV